MEWHKLDPGLASAVRDVGIDDSDSQLQIFVRTTRPPSETEAEDAGVDARRSQRAVFTHTVRAGDIERLARQSWVRSLTLSQQLHPRPSGT